MRLIELNPKWISSGGEGITNSETHEPVSLIEKSAIEFDCPDKCGERRLVPIINEHNKRGWNLVDENLETLTLTPSIQVTTGCKTHFHITNGEITS